MLSVKIDEKNLVATLQPEGPLSASDFESAAKTIDPVIEKAGKLNGVIIYTKSFPGWDSFAALVSHLRFVKNHHEKVSHVAIVTDSPLGKFAEPVFRPLGFGWEIVVALLFGFVAKEIVVGTMGEIYLPNEKKEAAGEPPTFLQDGKFNI